MVRSPARFAAPLALAAVAVGVYLVVHSTVADHPRATSASATTLRTTQRPRAHRATPRFYTVRSGDTLSSISQRTGVPLARLTALNPSVAAPPYSLQTGQRLRLRR